MSSVKIECLLEIQMPSVRGCHLRFPERDSMFSEHIRSFPKLTKLFKATTVMRIIKLNKFPVPVQLRSGSGKLKKKSPCFAIFKNIVHSFEPGETPSNSASHRAPNYAQRF